MDINWIKASEIVFDGLVQAIIGALTIFISFRLGQIQSNKDWKRRLSLNEEERKRQERIMKLQRQIALIREVIFNFPFVEFHIKDGPDFLKNREETLENLIRQSYIAAASIDDSEVSECMNDLYEITGRFITGGSVDRFYEKFIEINSFLISKLSQLESDLVLKTKEAASP